MKVRKFSNFDKQAYLLKRLLERFRGTSDEICVKEIQDMAEASLSIKTSYRGSDNLVSTFKWQKQWQGQRKTGEKAEGFPHIIKRKRQGRTRGRAERMKALLRDAKGFCKMEKESMEATTNTLASKGTKPSTKRPKHTLHVKIIPFNDELVEFRGLAKLRRCNVSLLERACIGPDLPLCPNRRLGLPESAYEKLGKLLFAHFKKTERNDTGGTQPSPRTLGQGSRLGV